MDDETLTALTDDLDTAADTFVVLSRCLAVGEQIRRWRIDGDQIAAGSAADGLDQARGDLERLAAGGASALLALVKRALEELPQPME